MYRRIYLGTYMHIWLSHSVILFQWYYLWVTVTVLNCLWVKIFITDCFLIWYEYWKELKTSCSNVTKIKVFWENIIRQWHTSRLNIPTKLNFCCTVWLKRAIYVCICHFYIIFIFIKNKNENEVNFTLINMVSITYEIMRSE